MLSAASAQALIVPPPNEISQALQSFKKINSKNLCARYGLFSAVYWYTVGALASIYSSKAVNRGPKHPCLS